MPSPPPPLQQQLVMVVLLVLLVAQSARAIFSDQAGLNDWTRQHVGELLAAVEAPGGRVLVATCQGVLASLRKDNGEIEWRRVLPEPVDDIAVGFPLILTRSRNYVRSWTVDGRMSWDFYSSSSTIRDVLVLNGGKAVLVLTDTKVVHLDGFSGVISGKLSVELRAPSSSQPAQFVSVDGGDQVFVVTASQRVSAGGEEEDKNSSTARSGGDAATIVSVERLKGGSKDNAVPPEAVVEMRTRANQGFALTRTGILGVPHETNQKRVVTLDLASRKTTEVDVVSSGDPHAPLVALSADKQVLVVGSTHVLVRDANGAVLLTRLHQGSDGTSAAALHPKTGDLFVISYDQASRGVKITQSAFNRNDKTAAFNAPSLYAEENEDSSSVRTFQAAWALSPTSVLAQTHDLELALFDLGSGGTAVRVWSREEALADVVQVVSTSLPHVSRAPAANEASRMLRHFQQLVETAVSVAASVEDFSRTISRAVLQVAQGGRFELKTAVQESSDEERSRFGFSRVFVILTKRNKVFAIHSENGKVMWMRILPPGFTPQLLVRRDVPPEPVVMVLDTSAGRVVELASVTGKTVAALSTCSAGLGVLQTMVLPVAQHHHHQQQQQQQHGNAASASARSFVILSEDLSVREYPAAPAAVYPTPLFLHVLNNATNEFVGYRITGSGRKAVVAWSIVFPGSSRIVNFASPREFRDPVSSPVRVLGDGSLLVKHINPHLVGVATLDAGNGGIRMHLIDTVSGRIVHRASHKDAEAPVHAVRFENWLVYSLNNPKTSRNELHAMSLYEKAPIAKRQLNPWTKVPPVLDTNFSSFVPADVSILQRTFYFPGHTITALGVTTTLRGIAAKNLLVSLGGTGQILMLDQRFIDPRRTSGPPTEEEKVEGLFQYSPELPLVPMHILSYYRGAGENGAHMFYVAPAFLESSCTILACGLDMFKGRASPSGAFDLLAEDFNYALLMLFIGALAVAAYTLRTMERKKSLKHAWM